MVIVDTDAVCHCAKINNYKIFAMYNNLHFLVVFFLIQILITYFTKY